MDLNLRGRFALVTGGSHGIGRSIALGLAEEGCNVAICARRQETIEDVLVEIRKKNVQALGLVADAMIKADIARTIEKMIDAWNTIHILVNNVGGGGRWGSEDIENTSEDVWTEVFTKNTLAAIRFTRLVIPFMRRQKWGRVVTISSIYGKEGGGRPWFNLAKSAEISLMKTLAMSHSLVRDGITFNSVAPGSIMIPDTGWAKEQLQNPAKFYELLDTQFPLGRLGSPEEVANVVVFLCSERASLVNGASIVIDGAESRSF